MILEFTGLPGAGKTTFESCVKLGLKRHGIRVISRAELKDKYIQGIISPNYEDHAAIRILSNRLYRLSNWKGLINAGLGRGIFREVMTKRRRMVFSWLGEDINLSTYFLNEFNSPGAEPSAYIGNEGFVHHSVSFKVWGGVGFPDLSQKLLQKFSSGKFIIIHFKISVDDALGRIWKRGLPENWPRSINSKPKVKEVLLRFDRTINEVVNEFKAKGVKVFPVDTSPELQQVESEIKTLLNNFPEINNLRELQIQPDEN